MRILVTGASGQLGAYLLPALIDAGHEPIAWGGSTGGERAGVPIRPIDLTDIPGVARALERADPAAVLHLAAISSAAAVLADPRRARSVNVAATATLAGWCARRQRRLIFTSTDLVFDGSRSWSPESAPAEPVLLYGRTKHDAEAPVIESRVGLVARLPLLFGPSRCGRPGFFDAAVAAVRRGEPRTFFEDEFRTPLDYGTAARALVCLVASEVTGRLHVAGAERLSRFELMRRATRAMGLDASLVRGNRRADVPGPEPRPADVSLDTTRWTGVLPGLQRPTVEQAAGEWR